MSRHFVRQGRIVSVEIDEKEKGQREPLRYEGQNHKSEAFMKTDSRQNWTGRTPVPPNEPPPDSYRLVSFSAFLNSTILEDTLPQLRYLDELNTELRHIKAMAEFAQMRALKYGVAQPLVSDELQGIDRKNLHKKEYKLAKLCNDRKIVHDTILQLYKELALKRSFRPLLDYIHEVLERQRYRETVQAEEIRLKATRKDIVKMMRQQRNHIKSTYYDTDVLIDKLKTQVEDLVLEAETKCRYAGSWQIARMEQLHETIRQKENGSYHGLRFYKTKLDGEHRVHSEIEMLALMQMNEKLERVEFVMNKYDEDIEAIDLKITIRKNDHSVALEERKDLEHLIKNHTDDISNWQKFKQDRETLRLYNEKMDKAAVTVQAWWRGLLVRKELGPYKPKKKGGGGKKKKNVD